MTHLQNQNKPSSRSINGVLLLDKPLGMSSNQALQLAKRIFHAKKAGHTGSLDPLATGMLPICFGEATKFSQFLLDADKFYQVEFKLGETTTTGDAEGEILEKKPVNVSQENVISVLDTFIGSSFQIPPMYSALKHQGQPLYRLARQGIEVPRKERQITLFALTLLSFDGVKGVFDVHCTKGTYIRTLVEDIGKALGCGAHVTQLRRLSVGPYHASQMKTLEQLKSQLENLESFLLPIETLLISFPDVQLTSLTTFHIRRGQAVFIPHAPTEGFVKLISHEGKFLGVGAILSDGRVTPKRLIN